MNIFINLKKPTMKSAIETGHAKNLANLDQLISLASVMDGNYNPSNSALKIESLQALSGSCRDAMNAINSAFALYSNAVDTRENAFAPLGKIVTRLGNALKASTAADGANLTARSLISKIQGRRISPKRTETQKEADLKAGITRKEISSSQMSFDNRLENFGKLVEFLVSIPEYKPNEKDLQPAFLKAFYEELKKKNSAVISAYGTLSNARIARNALMYKPKTGLVDVALNVKTYIKSVFGTTSPQYRQIASIDFSKF